MAAFSASRLVCSATARITSSTRRMGWVCSAPSSLPAEAAELINDRDHELFFSAASIWEVGIKNAMGKSA